MSEPDCDPAEHPNTEQAGEEVEGEFRELDPEHAESLSAEPPVPTPPPAPMPPVPPAAIPPAPVASDLTAEEAAVEPPRPDPLATGVAILVMVSLLVCAVVVLIAAANA